MTTLAIVKLTDDETTWLGADVVFVGDLGLRGTGQVVALAPEPGHVWVCDGERFHQVQTSELSPGWTEEPLL